MVVGGAFMPLFVLGVVPRRDETRWLPWIRATWALVLVVLSLLAWRSHGFGGSVGYLRHMVSVGPMMGLLIAAGLSRALEPRPSRWGWVALGVLLCAAIPAFDLHLATWEHPVNRAVEPWIWPVGALATVALLLLRLPARTRITGIVVAGAVTTLLAEPPIGLDGERQLVRDAAEWVRANRPGRPVAVNHPWFPFLLGEDRNDAARFPHLDLASLSTLPAGTIVVWEPHYGPRIGGDVPLTHFAEHPERYVPIYKDDVRRDVPGYGEHVFPLVVFEVAP